MEHIGRYEVLEELGRGAMGAVYKARDPQIGRVVAIKVILTANLSAEDLQHYKQRFQREAQTAGQMSHPGIVTIHDIAEDEQGQPYLVMEFVKGRSLESLLKPSGTAERYAVGAKSQRLPIEQALDIAIQVAEALDYAHRRNVIHRDIKPANILIAEEEGAAGTGSSLRAKIADFGIAKLLGSGTTQTGMMMGTPAFMSPEQVQVGGVDSRSDIFSLGGVIYWMLTGEKPFPGESVTQITFKVVFGAPLPAVYVNASLPQDIDIVLSRCFAKNPDDRYQTARELAADLELIKSGKPVTTTAAPIVDMTVLQPNPLPVVAAGLPPDKRPPQSPLPYFTDSTVHLGSQPQSAAVPPAPAEDTTVGVPGLRKVSPVQGDTEHLPAPKMEKKEGSGAKLAVAGFALLGLVVVAGYVWKSRAPSQLPTQQVTQTVPQSAPSTPAPPPADIQKAPETKAASAPGVTTSGTEAAVAKPVEATPPPAKKVVPAAKSTLKIDCQHNFKEATLTILVDGRVFLEEPLTENKRLAVSKPIPSGMRVLKVRVRSEKPKFDQEQEIGGTFSSGAARTLGIEFGKGSGLGLRGRKLTLKWLEGAE